MRKAEYGVWASRLPLPPRFATYGAVYEGNLFEATVRHKRSAMKRYCRQREPRQGACKGLCV